MGKASTRAAKRRAKAGRPQKLDAPRTSSGRISRSREARATMTLSEERLALEAATWRRRRENPSLSVHEARKPEYGSVIERWRQNYARQSAKQKEDNCHADQFTSVHYDMAVSFHELHEKYRAIIGATRPRSSSEFGKVKAYNGSDPFGQCARGHKAIETKYQEARREILKAGPFCMFAVEVIVIDNKDCPQMMGDLRLALNALTSVLGRNDDGA